MQGNSLPDLHYVTQSWRLKLRINSCFGISLPCKTAYNPAKTQPCAFSLRMKSLSNQAILIIVIFIWCYSQVSTGCLSHGDGWYLQSLNFFLPSILGREKSPETNVLFKYRRKRVILNWIYADADPVVGFVFKVVFFWKGWQCPQLGGLAQKDPVKVYG